MSAPITGKDFGTAVGRWSGLGPYYAMFPIDFAFEVVRTYSDLGMAILDPFAGRGTSVYAAACQERVGYGVEINPVGWLYGVVKLKPSTETHVQRRLKHIWAISQSQDAASTSHLPAFFRSCYSPRVLSFLTTARRELRWRTSTTDATLMSLILVYLHGKDGSALSNQMRQGKSMSPDYSVRWWQSRGKEPPDLDVHDFLQHRIAWRYAKGTLRSGSSRVYLGDSTRSLNRLGAMPQTKKCQLLFTSPPYHSITNYHTDQWLRLWMLGGAERPAARLGEWQGKFDSKVGYERLLRSVFTAAKTFLADDANLYVRTDARPFTLDTTVKVLTDLFPNKDLATKVQPLTGKSQTRLFGDTDTKPGEVDLILMDRA